MPELYSNETRKKGSAVDLHMHLCYPETISQHEETGLYISKADKRPLQETQQHSS